MFENFLNDKLSREFLTNHIGKELIVQGVFITYDKKHRILAENCSYFDDLIDTYIDLGHMWWQNIINHKEYSNIAKNSTIKIMCKVVAYKSNDKNYSYPVTYGLTDCRILEVY